MRLAEVCSKKDDDRSAPQVTGRSAVYNKRKLRVRSPGEWSFAAFLSQYIVFAWTNYLKYQDKI